MADIITYPENGITYDADDASGYLATRLSGVYSAEEDFSVTAQGGLSVQVSAGQAWVRPARFKGRSIIMEQPTTVVLTEADPVRSRIDRIVLRYDAAAKLAAWAISMSESMCCSFNNKITKKPKSFWTQPDAGRGALCRQARVRGQSQFSKCAIDRAVCL